MNGRIVLARVTVGCLASFFAAVSFAQSTFHSLNVPAQYTTNFNAWEDAGGANGGNYAFVYGPTAGIGGSGGISVFQSTDTTATFRNGFWNLSTNGATIMLSVLIKANGQTSGNKVQLGVMNNNTNGLNSNGGVAFESFRFVPTSSTVWSLREQYRTNGVTAPETVLGNVAVSPGRWYQFVVTVTNTSGPSGNYSAACALFDFGPDGLLPGTNVIPFSTVVNRAAQEIAMVPAIWPSLRAFQDAGIDAWDNFLVYTRNSAPIITWPLTNVTVVRNMAATLGILADGPGTLAYAWYTNGTLVSGVSGRTYVTPPLNAGLSNVTVVVSNANGSVSNQVAVTAIDPTLAQVTNLPASTISSSSATLNGQVLSTGGDPPVITIFYGPTNGGTNAAAWSNSVTLGARSGAFAQTVTALSAQTTYYYTARAVNSVGASWAAPSQSFLTSSLTMSPMAVSGFNRDVVVENSAAGPPYTAAALEFNPGENTAFYQNGLPGKLYGLPLGGSFVSALGDGTVFQFAPYAGPNALVLSSQTGISSGQLTLVTPATYSRIGVMAHSGSGGGTPNLTLHFNDGSSLVTTYNASDWFFNNGFALQGVDRINLTSGATGGGPNDPRFYQTTIPIGALLGSSNRPLTALTFEQAPANATAIYAVSGLPAAAIGIPAVTNSAATGIQARAATLGGVVVSTGGESPAMTLFYGPVDGGTNPAAWARSTNAGFHSGPFTQPVTGLVQNTTYFFTARAVNSAGTAWATPSKSFTTIVAALPAVSNLAATSVTAGSATLRGQVTVTGGDPPSITLFYGPVDGGTVSGAWAQSVELGLQSSVYARNVFGLAPSTAYYFTARAVNSAGTVWATPSLLFGTASQSQAPVAVLSQHNDPPRTGANLNETILNVANVNTNQFGLLYARPLDDQVYAQPLIATNVVIPGQGPRNVVYVCTVNNSVYAFDADDPTITNAYWQVSYVGLFNGTNAVAPRNTDMTGACGGNYRDFSGNMGIVSTPVIDPVSGTIYLVARTKEMTASATNYVQRLHALDLRTGAERSNSPVVITATYGGTGAGSVGGVIAFDPQKHNQRSGLTLVNGVVYIGWASHCDWGPYHGWLMGYDAVSLQRVVTYMTTRNGSAAGIWMSGAPPASDENGNLYISTGNGSVGVAGNRADLNNRGESLLKLTRSGTNLVITSWFTPYNWQALENGDIDLGSGGVLLIPGTTLALSGGKEGKLYLVNRDNMGGLSGSPTADTNVVQSWQVTGINNPNDLHGAPVWWDGPEASYAYIWGEFHYLRQYQFDWAGGKFFMPEYASSLVQAPNGMPGGILSLSALGSASGSGVLWASHQFSGDANQQVRPGILRAFNAQDVSQELWNSEQFSARDTVGNFAKFVPPTVANGKVYLATFSNRLHVYGLLPRPLLSIRLQGNNAILTWPTNGIYNYKLQRSTSLAPANWLDVPNPVTINSGMFQVTTPAAGSVLFYRLIK